MADKFTMPKGRMSVRKGGGRRTRLWELTGSSNPTVQRLEAAYLAGLDAMDRAEARHAANKADSRFTPDGVRDDLLKFVLERRGACPASRPNGHQESARRGGRAQVEAQDRRAGQDRHCGCVPPDGNKNTA